MRRHMLLMKNKSGFTLVEIMVSMIVLALLSSGFFSILVSARYLTNRSQWRMRAIEIAREEIENKRGLIRADTWYTPGSVLWASGNWSGSYLSPSDPHFLVRYKVESVPGCDCRKMTVQVQWNDVQI